jgi:5-methylcytosine-specific restriction endonuclease McrA
VPIPDSTTPLKRCRKCGVEFPATTEYFYKHETGRDGLRNYCKSCHYLSRRERGLAYAKEYGQRPEVIARRNKWQRERLLTNPAARQTKKDCDQRYHASPEAKARRKERDPAVRREYRKRPEVREKEMQYAKEYNQRPEAIALRRERAKKYRASHPQTEAMKMSQKVSQLRRRAASGSFTAADIEAIRVAQGNRCYLCGKKLKKYHVDHFIPIAKGGTSDPGNLRLACPKCNQSKHAKHPFELGILI